MARKPKLNGLNIAPHLHGEVSRILAAQRSAYLGTFDTKRSMSDVITEALEIYVAKFRADFALDGREIPDSKEQPEEFAELVRAIVAQRHQRNRSAH